MILSYNNKQFDPIVLATYVILIVIGWIAVYSSSYSDIEPSISLATTSGKQLLFIFISTLAGISILLIDGKLFIKLSNTIYLFSIISLILVLFLGKEVGGAKAWFKFGGFGIQPAEFAKLGVILAVAKFIHNQNTYLNNLNTLISLVIIIILPCSLILLQPDAGSAIVYSSLIIVFFREGLPLKYIITISMVVFLGLLTIITEINNIILILLIMTITIIILFWKKEEKFKVGLMFFIISSIVSISLNYSYENILKEHQKERIDIILGKEKNNLGSGYNLNQSLIAIGSGGLTGKGLFNGTQTKGDFIPEQNTDFIFCTIGEEFGLMGSVMMLSLYFILIIRIILLSEKAKNRFTRIFGYGLSSMIFAHTIINIGMTIGVVPVIGIPLPFISAGGSSLISFSIMLFIFIRINAMRVERF